MLKDISKKNYIGVATMLAVLYAPYTPLGYIIMATMLALCIFITKPHIDTTAVACCSVFIISMVVNVFIHNSYFDIKDLLLCIVLCIFLILYKDHNIIFNISDNIIFTLLLSIFISQVIITYNIEPFSSIITELYLSNEEDIYMGTFQDMLDSSYYRTGGFLGNANQCAKFCNLLFAIHLSSAENKKINFPITILFLSIIILAGSRTGFLVSVILFLVFIYQRIKQSKNITQFIIPILLAITLFSIGGYITTHMYTNLRILNIDNAMDHSLLVKTNVLKEYYDSITIEQDYFTFMFGNFFSSLSTIFMNQNHIELGKFDSDIGYLFYSYGIIGLLMILILTIKKFRTCHIKSYYYIIMLWIISASVYTHFKFIIFFTMVLLVIGNNHANTTTNKLNR